MSKQIKIQKFRTNDLNPGTGKQIEFGNSWCEDFFKIPSTELEKTLTLSFIPLSSDYQKWNGKIISLKLSNVTGRSDRKAYCNGNNGYSQLKDFFVTDLKLTEKDNLSDYFALLKISDSEYNLYYVPNLLYSNFVKFFEDETLNINTVLAPKEALTNYIGVGPLQQITYGAPGTGKSHGTEEKIEKLYPDKEERKQNVFRTTFHPDSDYSTFVGCYKPTTSKTSILNQDQLIKELNRMIAEEDSYALDKFAYTYWESFEYGINRNAFLSECGKTSQASHLNSGIALGKKFHKKNNSISYSFVPQAFTKAYIQAWRNILEGNNRNVFLVIEEINRGNCAQIFGDLFQLLDRDDEGYSKYAIKPDTDLENYLVESLGDKYDVDEGMKLPPNLYIWATMNTSDQSLFPMDSAFKRRWDWEYVPIDYEKAREYTVKFNDDEHTSMNWSAIIQVLNDNIMGLMHNADKQIGNRFISLPKGHTEISSKKFFNKVIFYLWSEIYKDYYEDESTIFRVDDKNISFEDLACEKNDNKLVKMLKSLKNKNNETIENIQNRPKE